MQKYFIVEIPLGMLAAKRLESSVNAELSKGWKVSGGPSEVQGSLIQAVVIDVPEPNHNDEGRVDPQGKT